jgi:hypothetical protein
MTFDSELATRLAAEMAEDDERATPGNWHAGDCISPQVVLYAVPADKAALRTVGEGDLLYLGRVYADGKGQGRRNMLAIARMRANAKAASEQLASAAYLIGRYETGYVTRLAFDGVRTALEGGAGQVCRPLHPPLGRRGAGEGGV